MALSIKIVGGDAPKQKIILRPKLRIRGVGLVVLKNDLLFYRPLGMQRKNITAEIGFSNGKTIVVEVNQRTSDQLSVFANQSKMSRQSSVGTARKSNPFGSFVRIVVVVISIGFLLSLCMIGSLAVLVSPQSNSPNTGESKIPSASESAKMSGEERILGSSLPEYSIISSITQPPIKAMVEVRLNNKIEEDDIEGIANAIRNSLQGNFDRIFITYYLPEMEVGAGAWATSHWNPVLKINVLGMTVTEEQDLLVDQTDAENRIGRWKDERPFISSIIVLLDLDGVIQLSQLYKDGSKSVENATVNGNRYVLDNGEYLIINRQGNLEWYDPEGLVVTCYTMP